MIDEIGARKLIAAVLKQAADDYKKDSSCPKYCPMISTCEKSREDRAGCDARRFIHSAWCATLTDGIGIDNEQYVQACIQSHGLAKHTYQYVLREICEYKNTLKEVERLKRDIILATGEQNEVRGTDVGKKTENLAIKICHDKRIAECERTIKAIESVYNRIDRNKRAVMENCWLNRYTVSGIANDVGVSEKTIKRWRQNIVYKVAIELKYL